MTTGTGATPVPLSATVCGLAVPLSLMVAAALRAPVAVGVNVTLMVQLAPMASVAGLNGHVVVRAKSPGLVPVMAMLLRVSAPGPLFVTVTLCGALVVLVV